MIRRFIALMMFFLTAVSVFTYSKDVESFLSTVKDKDISGALDILEEKISSCKTVQETRDLLTFTASLQERYGMYELAGKNYEKAAALQASSGSESAASLLINAARCALSYGDAQLADTYLSAVARTPVDAALSPKIKLYAVWSWLSKTADDASLHEPLVILKSYIDMKGMESVQTGVLLTLWYFTGEEQYSNQLETKYPSSMESAVVQGKIQLMPTPFWYFVPRKVPVSIPPSISDTASSPASADNSSIPASEEKSDTSSVQKTAAVSGTGKTESESTTILHYQLGFFRDSENAQDLVDRLKKAGFSPSVLEEVRQSGTTYYAVIVKESSSNDMGAKLKNAGFECYPVYE